MCFTRGILRANTGISPLPFLTAFGSVLKALAALKVTRVALGAPYAYESMLKSKAHLELHGFQVPGCGVLENVENIYDETPERAYDLGKKVNTPDAQAVFLTGVGMPTLDMLGRLEKDLGKPVISAASAMMSPDIDTAFVRMVMFRIMDSGTSDSRFPSRRINNRSPVRPR